MEANQLQVEITERGNPIMSTS